MGVLKNRIHLLLTLCLVAAAFSLTACSDDGDGAGVQARITVVFSPGGLGDNGYNDLILRGVQQIYMSRSEAEVNFYSPSSNSEAASRLRSWWQQENSDGIRELYVLAGSDYDEVVATCCAELGDLPEGKEILLFESDNVYATSVYTFRISMYGAAYLCGKATAMIGCTPVILLSNPQDGTIRMAADGFAAGFGSAVEVDYLADDWTGYALPDKAYTVAEQLMQEYDFIFCVAGGSNSGIYRYLREYPYGRGWTAGMDVDQSAYSNKIIGSLVKHIDQLIEDYLNDWIDGSELPKHMLYGLQSGYEEWLVSSEYSEFFAELADDYKQDAIREEGEYEEDL